LCWNGDAVFGGMEMVDASLVLDAIVAVSIAAGAIFAVWELRGMSRARRTELVAQIMQYVNNPEFMDTYIRVWRTNIKDAKDAEQACSAGELVALTSFFETLGFSVWNKDVDAKPVLILLGPMTMNMWDKLGPWTSERRKDFSPTVLTYFEWLANEVKSSRKEIEAILVSTHRSP